MKRVKDKVSLNIIEKIQIYPIIALSSKEKIGVSLSLTRKRDLVCLFKKKKTSVYDLYCNNTIK